MKPKISRPRAKAQEEQALAKNDPKDSEQNAGNSSTSNKEGKPQETESSLTAKAGKQNESAQKPNNGQEPPENPMSKRMLDAGQASACKPQNIMVDEYAGTFEGEKRKKLEIAIDPVLKQLEALLAKAQEKTDSLKEPARSAEGLRATHAAPLGDAKAHLTESQKAVSDLKSRTANTPYAFIGLATAQHQRGAHHAGEPEPRPRGDSCGERGNKRRAHRQGIVPHQPRARDARRPDEDLRDGKTRPADRRCDAEAEQDVPGISRRLSSVARQQKAGDQFV